MATSVRNVGGADFVIYARFNNQWRDMLGRWARVNTANRLGERLAEAGPKLVNEAKDVTPRRSGAAARSWRAKLVGMGSRTPSLEIDNEMPYGMVLVFGHQGPYDIPNAWGRGPGFGIGGRFGGKFHPANKPNMALAAWADSIAVKGRVLLRDAGGDVIRDLKG